MNIGPVCSSVNWWIYVAVYSSVNRWTYRPNRRIYRLIPQPWFFPMRPLRHLSLHKKNWTAAVVTALRATRLAPAPPARPLAVLSVDGPTFAPPTALDATAIIPVAGPAAMPNAIRPASALPAPHLPPRRRPGTSATRFASASLALGSTCHPRP
jgi:hypothetical protein